MVLIYIRMFSPHVHVSVLTSISVLYGVYGREVVILSSAL